jgi:glycosyltransferase involved in cell wall biosynthesis
MTYSYIIVKKFSKNILIISPLYSPEINRVNDLVEHLLIQGHKITVMCPIPNYPKGKYYEGYGIIKKRYEKFKNLKICRILVFPRGNGSKINLFFNYLSFIIFSIIPAITLSFQKFDLVFINQVSPITIAMPGIIVKKIKRIPLIMWVTDLWPESVKDAGNLKSNFIPNLILPVVRYIYKNCDQILVSSKAFINSVKEKSSVEKNVIYMPQWGESTFTNNQSIKYHNNEFENIEGFKILFAGNVGIAQDFDCIINAMNKIKDHPIHLVVLGDGRAKKESIKKVRELNLESNVSFLGSFPLETMPYFFDKSDALLISLKKSIVFSKTIPAKTQSYMAFGKPILTNADGEVSRIIDESNSGLTADSGNHILLAENMLKLSKLSDTEIKTMINNCKTYYKNNFNRDKILNGFEKIIYDITN